MAKNLLNLRSKYRVPFFIPIHEVHTFYVLFFWMAWNDKSMVARMASVAMPQVKSQGMHVSLCKFWQMRNQAKGFYF
jgi:hypothetical protein